MRATAIVLATCAVLSACDAAVDTVASRIARDKIIVMAPAPLMLTVRPMEIVAAQPMEVLGEWTSVCLVLKDGVPHSDAMDAEFTAAMHNSKVSASVLLSDGSRMSLSAPSPGWRRSGAILRRDELAGCASAGCLPRLPKGAFVTQVMLTAEPDLPVQGVYWISSPDLPSKVTPVPSTATTSTRTEGKCS